MNSFFHFIFLLNIQNFEDCKSRIIFKILQVILFVFSQNRYFVVISLFEVF